MGYPQYSMGIKRDEHVAFYDWCKRQGLLTDHIRNDPTAFWVRWMKQWIRVPEYGRVDPTINYLIYQFRNGDDIKTRRTP